MINSKSLIKTSIIYVISDFIVKGISFFLLPFYSRILEKDEFGRINNYFTWQSIVVIIASLSLIATINRARYDFKEDFESYIFTISTTGLAFSLVLLTPVFIFYSYFADIVCLDIKYFILICLFSSFYPFIDYLLIINRFNYNVKFVVICSLVTAVLSELLSICFVLTFDDKAFGRVLGSCVVYFATGLILYCYIIKKSHVYNFKYLKYAIPICIPYMFHLLSGTILNASDKNMITILLNETETANYSFACSIASIANILWLAMNNAFAPWQTERLHDKKYNNIKHALYYYIAIFLYCSLGLILIAPELSYILGSNKYTASLEAVPPLVIGYVFLFLYSIFVNAEQYEKKTLPMSIATVTSASLNIILNYMLIPKYGFVAAAYTSLISYFSLLLMHYLIVKFMRLESFYDDVYLFLTVLISIGFCFLALMLYKDLKLRILALCVYCSVSILLLFLNRKKIGYFVIDLKIKISKND